jgi:hypothetical protein
MKLINDFNDNMAEGVGFESNNGIGNKGSTEIHILDTYYVLKTSIRRAGPSRTPKRLRDA